MGYLIGEGYWSHDNGTASIFSRGVIGRERKDWDNGVRNNITCLFTVNRGQRTPRGNAVCELYQNNTWTDWFTRAVPSYYSWVAFNFNIQGIYNRWLRISFGGATIYFKVGHPTDAQQIPPEIDEDETEEPEYTEAIEEIIANIDNLNEAFASRNEHIDAEIENFRVTLVERFEESERRTEELIESTSTSLYDRITTAWTNGVSGVTASVRGAIANIRGMYEDIADIYSEINKLKSGMSTLQETLISNIIEAVISYIWDILERILDSELIEKE